MQSSSCTHQLHSSGQRLRELKDLVRTNAALSDKTARGLVSLVSSPTMPGQLLDSPLSLCWARGVFSKLESAHSHFVGQGVCLPCWSRPTLTLLGKGYVYHAGVGPLSLCWARGVFTMLESVHSHFVGQGVYACLAVTCHLHFWHNEQQ